MNAFENVYSVLFDGVDDYMVTGADSTLASKSYSFWAKSIETGVNGAFDHGSQSTGAFHFNYSGGRALLYMAASYFRYWVDNSAQDDGAWHHHVVYIEYDDITNCKWYVDGILQTPDLTISGTAAVAYTTGLRIGKSHTGGFEGNLDEFAIFDGELSAAQVVAIYNGGVPADLTGLSGLEHWWRMGDSNDGAGTLIYDELDKTLGSELVVADPYTAARWTMSGGNTETLVAGESVRIDRPASGGNSAGGYSYLTDTSIGFLASNLVANTTYKITFTFDTDDSNCRADILGFVGGHNYSTAGAGEKTMYLHFTSGAPYITFNDLDPSKFLKVSNLSVKAVGGNAGILINGPTFSTSVP
tara:strand:+ start:309 stop:1379 length:1071 start_codon:yes stop_codon:yes gene_type:complete